MKRLQLRYNPQTRYKNGKPRYASERWCKKVASNENLTPCDHARFASDLRLTGNFEGLLTIQKLLKEKIR
ncbi:hypothetical protein [Pontibacter beigongshangensis]|uniref:hypothetical protein n=1 Tax=Pontibacter beigongshangensis TaxID=2574733 RepID=UPI00164FCE87|nr:hypothetical protein [Pontibacter beigongshangensis]